MDIDRDTQTARARVDIVNVHGPDSGSVTLNCVDPDAVVQRARVRIPKRSERMTRLCRVIEEITTRLPHGGLPFRILGGAN